MDEVEYKSTYQTVNQNRCVFEKAISSRRCNCSQSHRFHLADREGVACQSREGLEWCTEFLNIMHEKSRFSLHLKSAIDPLPHAKEIKVQLGGLLGLHASIKKKTESRATIMDIYGILKQAISLCGRINDFPYEDIVQSIASFKGRSKRSDLKK